jgi:hypothetical protein
MIKPIYQTENQHSKKISIWWTYQFPRAKGKYIALCEGDDYWCDENKLQLQYDALENSDAVFCAHRVRYIKEDGTYTNITKPRNADGDFGMNQDEFMHLLIDKYICPFQTSSFMFRKEIVEDGVRPEFMKLSPVGDVSLMFYSASKGGLYYIEKEMSCYRMFSSSSWSLRIKNDLSNQLDQEERYCQSFSAFNEYTNYKYNDNIQKLILKRKYIILRLGGQYKRLLEPPYVDLVKKLPVKGKASIFFRAYTPRLMKSLDRIRGRIV